MKTQNQIWDRLWNHIIDAVAADILKKFGWDWTHALNVRSKPTHIIKKQVQ